MRFTVLVKLSWRYFNATDWIEAFLTDRVQGVVVEAFMSPEGKVLSGVQPGTVLGHLLFLLDINDLPSVITSQIRLFTDDCLIYCPISL